MPKLKENAVPFAVIIGIDEDKIVCPDFKCAQKSPDSAVTYDSIETLYLIDDKSAPKYSLIDGLKRLNP